MRSISKFWDEMRDPSSVNKVDGDRQDSSTSAGMHTQLHMQLHKCYVHPTITEYTHANPLPTTYMYYKTRRNCQLSDLVASKTEKCLFSFCFYLSSFWRNFYNNYMNFPCPGCAWSHFILWPPIFCHGCHGKTVLSACQRKPHSPALLRQCGVKGEQGEQITV